MKFSDFKISAPKVEDVCDPCRIEYCEKCTIIKSHCICGKSQVLPSEDDSPDLEAVISLRQGWCPICYYKVTCEPDHKRTGVNKFQCTENPSHYWDVDYVNYRMVRD